MASLPECVPNLVEHLLKAGVDVEKLQYVMCAYREDVCAVLDTDIDHMADPAMYVEVLDYLNVIEAFLPYLIVRK